MVDKLNTKATFEAGSDNKGTLSFEISADQVQKGLDIAFDKVKDEIQIDGFRKGKITKEIFNQRFGEEALYEEALNAVLPANFDEAVEEVGINTVGQPEILPETLKKGGPWSLKAKVTLAPQVKLGVYKGVTVPKEDTSVSDDEIKTELEHMQQMEAELKPADKDYAAKNGDTVVIDFDGSVDGVHFDGGKSENFSLSLGSGQFIPGFEEQLVGHKAGEDVDVNVTFPTEYQAEDLAGKDALFEVKIHEVKQLELPTIDDEFAKDVDDQVATLAELKEKIKDRIAKQKEETATGDFENNAIQAAVDNAELKTEDIPSEMIEDDVHRQMNQFFSNMQSQGIAPEMYFQLTGQTEADLHKQFEDDSPNRIKTNLVLQEIAKQEDFKVSDDELEIEYARLATQYQMDVEKLEEMITPAIVSQDMKIQRAVKTVVDNAKAK